MKPQSFEHFLRHATPPTPDPEARLRAKRAALAEFERSHLTRAGELNTSAPTGSTVSVGLLHLFRHARRPAAPNWVWRSGIASACVALIAVSVVCLMPAETRKVQWSYAPPPNSSLTREGKAELQSPPVIAQIQPEQGRQAVHHAEPEYERPPLPAARVNLPRARKTPSPRTETPAPEQVAPAVPAEEIVVQATRVQERIQDAPISITALPSSNSVSQTPPLSSNREEAVVVTSAKGRRSFLGRLFSRNAPVSGYPLLLVPQDSRDTFEHFEINPVKRVKDEPVSTFSADVDTASYSFVRRKLNEGVLPQKDAARVEEMINYFDYAWPASESRDQPFKPTVTVSDSPWGEGKKLIHIGIKGYELPVRERPDVNLVLLLDVSGSMNEPDKLPLAQRSMALLLDTLKSTDTVAIVVYAGAAGEVLAPTPVKDKETILQALNSLEPGGSTAGAEGIKLAYELAERNFRKNGVNRILLATDGDFNVGITDRNELKGFVEREREKGVFLSFLGFGEGNYRDDVAQVLAQNGNGVAAYIDTLNEARKVLVQESTASLFTIAKDVKLQVEFNPKTVAEYRLVGYEKRRLNREDFNNDKVDAGDIGSGHAVTAIYEITPVGSKAKLIDNSRYEGGEGAAADLRGKAGEYGFLRIRYKLPDSSRSKLIEQPIRVNAGVPERVKEDVSFSTAVAGFGQLLRGGSYTGSLTYEEVIRQASGAIGEDPYGYRKEFVELVRKAQSARGM
jgi:Ca-activated chloride channel family protein